MPQHAITSHVQGKMGEDAEYVLAELTPAINMLAKKAMESDPALLLLASHLEQKVSKKDMEEVYKILNPLMDRIKNLEQQLQSVIPYIVTSDAAVKSIPDLMASVNLCSEKDEKIKIGLLALADKLDADVVDGLDNDYKAATLAAMI